MDTNTILWLLLAAAGIWLFWRMMHGGGCCGGDEAEETAAAPRQRHAQEPRDVGEVAGATSPSAAQIYAVDPVCGMEVSATSVHRSQHHGQTRFFCSSRCKESYEADPERYEAAAATAAMQEMHSA